LVAVWLSACKKQAEVLPPQDLLLHKAKLFFKTKQEESLQIFLENQAIQREQTSTFNTLAYRTFLPDWAKSKTIYRNNGNVVILTPVSRSLCTRYADDLYYIRRLRTEFDINGNVLSSSIVELVTLDETTAQKQNAILKELQNYLQNDFSGYVYQYDLAYNLQNEWLGTSQVEGVTIICFEPHYMDICGVFTITYIPIPCRTSNETGGKSSQKITVVPCTGGDNGGVSAGGGGGGSSGGTNPTTPNPTTPNPGLCSDLGQDVPFNPNQIKYNGLKINQKYKNKQGRTVDVDTNLVKAFKFVIDNSTYREIISSYLAPNTDTLTISFDINAGGGYFDSATNTIYINPEQLQNIGMLDMVNILVHESIHAMFFRPNTTIQAQLNSAASTLATHYTDPPASTNMIHHEAMGQYYKDAVISILKSFHESDLGVVQNSVNITDNHFEAIFLFSLLQTQYPAGSGNMILMWITQFNGRSYAIQRGLALKADEIRNIYLNP
jgi:hypothetical protein